MYCKHCGNSAPGDFEYCPTCGKPLTKNAENRQKEKVGIILLLIAVGCMLIVFFIIASGGLNDSKPGTEKAQSVSATTSNSTQPTEKKWIPEGMYKIGTDIPEGEYFVWATSYFCSVQVSSDSSGSVASNITTEMCDTFMFISVRSGQYLDVSGGSFVPANIAPVPEMQENGTYKPGMYRVGIDIPAGEYKVAATDDFCYIQVLKDSFGLISSHVNTEYVDGQAYVTVIEGQYLSVKNGVFAPVE